MKANRNQTGTSPRFSRGLVLLTLAGVLTMLVYSSRPKRTASATPTPAAEFVAGENRPLETRRGQSAPRVFQVSASREARWINAFAAIEAEAELGAREEQWANLLAGISPADSAAVLDELQTAGLGEHEFTQRLLRRWAQVDGRGAAAWAEKLPAGAARDSALSGVAIEWANADLKSAAEWAQQLPDQAGRQSTLLAIVNEAVRTEPMEALRLAVDLPASNDRDDAIRRAATEWALSDGRSAVDWAKGISDPTLRHSVWAAEVVAWSDTAPEAAARFAIESLPPGRLLEDTVVSIVQRWWQQQPESAIAWVEEFPAGELKVAALENLTAMEGIQDRQSAEHEPINLAAP